MNNSSLRNLKEDTTREMVEEVVEQVVVLILPDQAPHHPCLTPEVIRPIKVQASCQVVESARLLKPEETLQTSTRIILATMLLDVPAMLR